MPRSVINASLDALAIGGTMQMPKSRLAPAYRKLPAKLAREFNLATGKHVRALIVRDAVFFVRVG